MNVPQNRTVVPQNPPLMIRSSSAITAQQVQQAHMLLAMGTSAGRLDVPGDSHGQNQSGNVKPAPQMQTVAQSQQNGTPSPKSVHAPHASKETSLDSSPLNLRATPAEKHSQHQQQQQKQHLSPPSATPAAALTSANTSNTTTTNVPSNNNQSAQQPISISRSLSNANANAGGGSSSGGESQSLQPLQGGRRLSTNKDTEANPALKIDVPRRSASFVDEDGVAGATPSNSLTTSNTDGQMTPRGRLLPEINRSGTGGPGLNSPTSASNNNGNSNNNNNNGTLQSPKNPAAPTNINKESSVISITLAPAGENAAAAPPQQQHQQQHVSFTVAQPASGAHPPLHPNAHRPPLAPGTVAQHPSQPSQSSLHPAESLELLLPPSTSTGNLSVMSGATGWGQKSVAALAGSTRASVYSEDDNDHTGTRSKPHSQEDLAGQESGMIKSDSWSNFSHMDRNSSIERIGSSSSQHFNTPRRHPGRPNNASIDRIASQAEDYYRVGSAGMNSSNPNLIDAELQASIDAAEDPVMQSLCKAISANDTRQVQEIISSHEFKVSPRRSQDPLIIACQLGRGRAVELMLKNGWNADLPGKGEPGKNTPIWFAIQSKSPYVVTILLDTGKAYQHIRDQAGNTPLHWAAALNDTRTLRVLLDRGAVVNAKNTAGQEPAALTTSLEPRQLLTSYPKPAFDPTMSEEALVALIESKATAKTLDVAEQGHLTIMETACMQGRLSAVELLLSKNASLEATGTGQGTVTHIAAATAQLGVLQLVLQHGADVEPVDGRGRTPVYKAAAAGIREAVELLLHYGASAFHRDFSSGLTPFEACSVVEIKNLMAATEPMDQPKINSALDQLRRTPKWSGNVFKPDFYKEIVEEEKVYEEFKGFQIADDAFMEDSEDDEEEMDQAAALKATLLRRKEEMSDDDISIDIKDRPHRYPRRVN